MKVCQNELETACAKDPSLECLKAMKHKTMSQDCRKAVFAEEREEVFDFFLPYCGYFLHNRSF